MEYENSKARIISSEQNEKMWVLEIDLYFLFIWPSVSVCYELIFMISPPFLSE